MMALNFFGSLKVMVDGSPGILVPKTVSWVVEALPIAVLRADTSKFSREIVGRVGLPVVGICRGELASGAAVEVVLPPVDVAVMPWSVCDTVISQAVPSS